MTKLKLGDRISLKLDGMKVVGPYSDYTEIRTFDIIGIDYYEDKYYLYVPQYITVHDSFKIDNYNYKRLGILPKFIGEEVLLIPERHIYQVVASLDGMFCHHCKEFSDYAQCNHGDRFVCWRCRQNPYI